MLFCSKENAGKCPGSEVSGALFSFAAVLWVLKSVAFCARSAGWLLLLMKSSSEAFEMLRLGYGALFDAVVECKE